MGAVSLPVTAERVLFLDIDGCLTSVRDGTSFLCMNPSKYGLSPTCLAMLRGLLDDTSAGVVVSSNWRRFPDNGVWIHDGYRFPTPLPALRRWLGDSYLGDLPSLRGATKSETMEMWGDENGVDFDTLNFAVVDDDYDEGFADNPKFMNRYVHCQPLDGLTAERCNAVRKTMGVPQRF